MVRIRCASSSKRAHATNFQTQAPDELENGTKLLQLYFSSLLHGKAVSQQ